MPNTNAVFDYYAGRNQEQPSRRYYSERSKIEAPTPVSKETPLAIEIDKADKLAQQGKVYNPHPELVSNRTFNADELVKQGIKTYLNSSEVDSKDAVRLLEQSRSQLQEAKTGNLQAYEPSKIELAIAQIDKEIDAYKSRGL